MKLVTVFQTKIVYFSLRLSVVFLDQGPTMGRGGYSAGCIFVWAYLHKFWLVCYILTAIPSSKTCLNLTTCSRYLWGSQSLFTFHPGLSKSVYVLAKSVSVPDQFEKLVIFSSKTWGTVFRFHVFRGDENETF